MFSVRVILLSHIVFTVTSAACCGENKDKCALTDCTGIVCSSDSHCDGQCCVGDSFFFKGHCGACHKTRHCRFLVSRDFCRKKCCGSDSTRLKCLQTCVGISCKSNTHCDGECCIGNGGNKTCAPCPKVTNPPPCTRNTECTTNCCRYGRCTSKIFCSSTERPSSPPTINTRCTHNLHCPTTCCKHGHCLPSRNCTSSDITTASRGAHLKTAIIIPVVCSVVLVLFALSFYCYLSRGKKRNVIHRASQRTSQSDPPPVTFYSDTNHGAPQSTRLPDPSPVTFHSDTYHEAPQSTRSPVPQSPNAHNNTEPVHYNDTDQEAPESTRPSDPPPPYVHDTTAPVILYNDTNHGASQSTRPLGPPPSYNDIFIGTPQSTRPSDPPPPYIDNSTEPVTAVISDNSHRAPQRTRQLGPNDSYEGTSSGHAVEGGNSDHVTRTNRQKTYV